ncbi:hypothetical protein MPSEU_000786900 [Mayamaea pseudoterrestris]|nr:hypothetical protein MPSEU_000786900 [Mayamaea pseudoterrestris]
MSTGPEGCFVRVNAAMLLSQKIDASLIVSVVGRYFKSSTQFQCSDGGTIALSTQYIEPPADLDVSGQGMVMEMVGQYADNALTVFVVRELSPDVDLSVYEKMIEVQHHPKYQQYFYLGTS